METKFPFWVKLVFGLQKRKYGVVLSPTLFWGRIPRVFLGFLVFYLSLERKKSPLSPVLRSLIQVRVAQLNSCSFCIDLNSALLMQRTKSEEKHLELPHWQKSSAYTNEERLALEYAEAMTDTSRKVDEALRSRLKGVFSKDQILELTALIAFQNLSAKFNSALDIESQGLCHSTTHLS